MSVNPLPQELIIPASEAVQLSHILKVAFQMLNTAQSERGKTSSVEQTKQRTQGMSIDKQRNKMVNAAPPLAVRPSTSNWDGLSLACRVKVRNQGRKIE